MTSSPLRLGIVGAGRATEKLYVPAAPQAPGGSIVAIADTRPERRDLIAQSVPGCTGYDSLTAMLAEANLDGVIVATPPGSHLAITREALAAGCAVLVEKPLAEDIEEAKAFVEEIGDQVAKVVVGYNRREWLPVRRMKDAASRMDLAGATVDGAFCIDVSGWDPIAGAVDPLDDLGTHYLDLVRYILEDEIATLSASRPAEKRIEIKLTTDRGIEVGLVHEHGTDTFEHFDLHAKNDRLRLQMGSDRIQPAAGLGRTLGDKIDKVKRKLAGNGWTLGESYARQLNNFYAVIEGKAKPSPSVHDGLRAMIATDAARRSASEGGKEITINGHA
ncbi:MAG: Gfo/Idh/MocA family oxidoreductase [Planctomycetota bacterium]